jgi:hypothetical protein
MPSCLSADALSIVHSFLQPTLKEKLCAFTLDLMTVKKLPIQYLRDVIFHAVSKKTRYAIRFVPSLGIPLFSHKNSDTDCNAGISPVEKRGL